MPASQAIDIYPELTVEVEPIDDEPEVYFTNQKPKFNLKISNSTDYNFIEGSELTWLIAIGSGMPEYTYKDYLSFEIEPGEEKEFEIGGELLAFEGHGVIGVSTGHPRRRGDQDFELQRANNVSRYNAVYTFSVWDKSQYEMVHELPKKLQKIAIAGTAAIVFFSIVQLVITLLTM